MPKYIRTNHFVSNVSKIWKKRKVFKQNCFWIIYKLHNSYFVLFVYFVIVCIYIYIVVVVVAPSIQATPSPPVRGSSGDQATKKVRDPNTGAISLLELRTAFSAVWKGTEITALGLRRSAPKPRSSLSILTNNGNK